MGIPQTPINKIADHAYQHSGKSGVNKLQVRTRLSLSHGSFPLEIRKLADSESLSNCNLFTIFLEIFLYLLHS